MTVQPHFAFSVSIRNYQEIIRNLSLSGINVVEESRDLRQDIWQAFFYDYDGNMLEIIATKE